MSLQCRLVANNGKLSAEARHCSWLVRECSKSGNGSVVVFTFVQESSNGIDRPADMSTLEPRSQPTWAGDE